jgi:hypothetical protein
MKLCSLTIKESLVCEVTAEYPLIFGLAPRLSPAWLREVLASAIHNYFEHRRNNGKPGVFRA